MADRPLSPHRTTLHATDAVALSALASATVATILAAAQLGLAFCGNRVAVRVPEFICGAHLLRNVVRTGAAAPSVDVCPVTLAFIVLTALLTAAAFALMYRDRAGFTPRVLLRKLSALPPRSAAATVTLVAVAPLTALFAGLPGTQGLLATAAALGLTFALTFAASLALVHGARRLIVTVYRTVARLLGGVFAVRARLRVGALRIAFVAPPADASVFSAGFGLRAPPSERFFAF